MGGVASLVTLQNNGFGPIVFSSSISIKLEPIN
jgi:hypothetical protein